VRSQQNPDLHVRRRAVQTILTLSSEFLRQSSPKPSASSSRSHLWLPHCLHSLSTQVSRPPDVLCARILFEARVQQPSIMLAGHVSIPRRISYVKTTPKVAVSRNGMAGGHGAQPVWCQRESYHIQAAAKRRIATARYTRKLLLVSLEKLFLRSCSRLGTAGIKQYLTWQGGVSPCRVQNWVLLPSQLRWNCMTYPDWAFETALATPPPTFISKLMEFPC